MCCPVRLPADLFVDDGLKPVDSIFLPIRRYDNRFEEENHGNATNSVRVHAPASVILRQYLQKE